MFILPSQFKAKNGALRSSRSEAGPFIMHYVYLLRSVSAPKQTYIGYTQNLQNRIKVHNAGGSSHTAKFRPWHLVTYLAFSDKPHAIAFEAYLKSHSGKAFAAKRLWSGS